MQFLQNSWYVAAFSEEVTRDLFRRVILDQPVLLYRREDGDPVAVFDRCPHRFAPLSRGDLIGDVVQCKYHGLRFDGSGQCVHNPHGTVIAPAMHLRAFPLVERHGLVWIWMGAPDRADPATIPYLGHIEEPNGLRLATFYEACPFRYDILVDNLLDLSHADYLHAGSFAGGAPQSAKTQIVNDGDAITVIRTQHRAPPLVGYPDRSEVDIELRTRWHPSQVLMFEIRLAPPGELATNAKRISQFSHAITPETAGTSHYFLMHSWDGSLSDEEFERRKVGQRKLITTEDLPMLLAVDREMQGQELMDLRPVILPTDRGAIMVRNRMKQLLSAEAGDAAP